MIEDGHGSCSIHLETEVITTHDSKFERLFGQESTVGKIPVRSYSFVFFTFLTFLHMLVSRPDSVRFLLF